MKLPAFLACLPLVACTTSADDTITVADDPAPTIAAATNMQLGVVSGSIYQDLYDHLGARMSDLAGLGTRMLRIEITQGVPLDHYKAIVDAAARYGITVLALVQSNAIGERPLDEDIEVYAQHLYTKIDQLIDSIPNLKYIEVENEPDVYDFNPLSGGNEEKYARLMVRVYEHETARRGGGDRPTIVGFDFSRPDQPFPQVYDATPITNHRAAYGTGLPVDIVSIHGYGFKDRLPNEGGYAYGGGTMRDGMNAYFGQRFSQSINGDTYLWTNKPVWVTELGFGWGPIGGLDRQSQAVQQGFDVLRSFPQISAAFAYDYRDDEGGGETAGLRANSGGGFAPHPAYYTFQSLAGGRGGQTFIDVPFSYWAHDNIEGVFAHGITVGCAGSYAAGNLEFCPERAVSKEEIHTFIQRAQGGPGDVPTSWTQANRDDMACALGQAIGAWAPYRGTFTDVFANTPCVNQIEGLYDRGIAKGWDNGNGTHSFQPWNSLSRAEMAAFLSRAYNLL